MSHLKINEMQECGEEGPQPAVKEAPLTNGHTHLNGALNPEDRSPVTDQDLPACRVKSSANKPHSSAALLQSRPDPYEFPHSPPKQSDFTVVESDTTKPTENHLKQNLQPSEKAHPSSSSCSFSHSPVRLNGSHHIAFSPDPASLMTTKAKPDPPIDQSACRSSTHLLQQTGGLISEFYSHSRLHQISTWRTGFSEYVNELHSKRKNTGGACFPGKDRLKKSVAQRATDGQGRERCMQICKSDVISPVPLSHVRCLMKEGVLKIPLNMLH